MLLQDVGNTMQLRLPTFKIHSLLSKLPAKASKCPGQKEHGSGMVK